METGFDFNKDYTLEDDRVLFRPLQTNDFQHLLVFSLSEPDTWKYGSITAAGEEHLKTYIQSALDGRQLKTMYPFVVFDKAIGEYAGSTRFYDIQLNNRTLQLGTTWYGKKFRGTGLNKHCKYLLLQFAFECMGMLRVEFRADLTNERSIAAMKSIGCIVEGVLRSDVLKIDGTRRDSIVLSILRDEWEGGVKERLANKL